MSRVRPKRSANTRSTCGPINDVTDLDIDGRRVRVRAPGGEAAFWEPYGELLIATGALPVWPDLPGGRANGFFGLSTLASGIAVHRYLDRERPRTAVIVGGGYIGLEMAEGWCGAGSISRRSSGRRR